MPDLIDAVSNDYREILDAMDADELAADVEDFNAKLKAARAQASDSVSFRIRSCSIRW